MVIATPTTLTPFKTQNRITLLGFYLLPLTKFASGNLISQNIFSKNIRFLILGMGCG